jgi:hypothetical protein
MDSRHRRISLNVGANGAQMVARVAHTMPFMHAPHEHGQHLCHRVLCVACAGFLTVADTKCNVGATPRSKVARWHSY